MTQKNIFSYTEFLIIPVVGVILIFFAAVLGIAQANQTNLNECEKYDQLGYMTKIETDTLLSTCYVMTEDNRWIKSEYLETSAAIDIELKKVQQ